MALSRALVLAAAALAAALGAAGAAPAADGLRPLQLAQDDQSDDRPTTVLTEEQKARIKSALENISPAEVKQFAADVVTGIEQYIEGVMSEGSKEQQERLAARVHRAYRVWKKDHDTPVRDDLDPLIIRLAALGVPVENVILPVVQRVLRDASAVKGDAAAAAAGDHPADAASHHR